MNNSDIAIGCTQDRLKFVGAITDNLYLNIPILFPAVCFHSSINRQFWICVQNFWVPVYIYICVCVCVCVCVSVNSNLTPPHKNRFIMQLVLHWFYREYLITWHCTLWLKLGQGRMNTRAFPPYLPHKFVQFATRNPTYCHLYSASHSIYTSSLFLLHSATVIGTECVMNCKWHVIEIL